MYGFHCPADLPAMFPTHSGLSMSAHALPMPAANTNSLDESFFRTADFYYLTFKVPVSRPLSAAYKNISWTPETNFILYVSTLLLLISEPLWAMD